MKKLLMMMGMLASVGSAHAFDVSLNNPMWRFIGVGVVVALIGMVAVMAAKSAPASAKKGLALGGTGLIALALIITVSGIAGLSLPGMAPTTLVTTGIVSTVAPTMVDAGYLSTTEPKAKWTLISDFTGGSLTEATNLYKLTKDNKGVEVLGSWTNFTSGTQLGTAIDAFSTVQIVFGITTTDETGNAYGPYIAEWQVPCSSSPVASFLGADDETASGLRSTFLNSIGSAAAEIASANSAITTFIRYSPSGDVTYGNKFAGKTRPNVFVVDMNNTEWDLTTKVKATIVQAPDECDCLGSLDRTGIPAYHSANYAGSGNFTVAWAFPAVYNDQEVRVKVSLDSDDTNAPSADNVLYYLYPGHFYVDSITNELNVGVEDESQNLVGQSAPEITVGDFT